MNEENSFYKNTFLLTAANITVGMLAFIFSIYLSKILGAEGVGLYNLVMPIYNLFIGLMTAGIIAAISKIAAVYSSRHDYSSLFKSLKSFAVFNLIWAIIIGIMVFFAAPAIGMMWVKDSRTILAIKITCPAMICIALSNILKGYFYGISKITMPAIVDIFEKAMRIVIFLMIVVAFSTDNLSTLVCAAYIALTYGEFQSLFLLYLYFRYTKRKIQYVPSKTENSFQLVFDILIVSLPLCLNAFLNNGFYTLSALVVPRRLVSAGFSYSSALEMIGKYSGMAIVISNFPIVIINSLNTVLVPDLSQTMEQKDYFLAKSRIKEVLAISFLLGLATIIVCNTVPDSLGYMFFSKKDIGLYIRAASIVCPISFSAMSMFGILNGLSRQKIILRNAIITETLEVTCLYFLTGIYRINVYGYAITALIINSLSLFLNLHEVKKNVDLDISLCNIVIFILAAILIYFMIKLCLPFMSSFNPIVKNTIVMIAGYGAMALFALRYQSRVNN